MLQTHDARNGTCSEKVFRGEDIPDVKKAHAQLGGYPWLGRGAHGFTRTQEHHYATQYTEHSLLRSIAVLFIFFLCRFFLSCRGLEN